MCQEIHDEKQMKQQQYELYQIHALKLETSHLKVEL